MQMFELIEVLEKEYPNDVARMQKMTDRERDVYIAQVEMIDFIKSLDDSPKTKVK
jgi:hypothetical protein